MELVVSISTDYYSGGNCVVILVGNNYICDCFQLDFFMQSISLRGIDHDCTVYYVPLFEIQPIKHDDTFFRFINILRDLYYRYI